MHAIWKRPRCGDCGMPMRWPMLIFRGRLGGAAEWSHRGDWWAENDALGDRVREDKNGTPYCAMCFTAENTERAQNARDEKHPSPTYTVRVTSVIAKDSRISFGPGKMIDLPDVSMFKEGQAIDIMSAPTRGDIRHKHRGREREANTWSAIDPYRVQFGALLPYDPAHRFDYATGERIGGMYLRGTFDGVPLIEDTRLTDHRGEFHYRVRFDGAFNTRVARRTGTGMVAP
jgi:hypothetical protein